MHHTSLLNVCAGILNTFLDIVSQSDQDSKTLPVKANGSRSYLFLSLLKGWTEKALEDAARMSRGHYEIYGHRDLLVTSLCRLLAGATKGGVYRTMTLPSYWTDSNLGSNGRFLTMNKHMARQGLRIERLFLVDRSFHELTEREQEILEFQLLAEENLKEKNFKVMVKQIAEEDLATFEKDGTLVAYLADTRSPFPKPDKCLCLNFVSHGSFKWLNGRKMIEHSIKKIRYWIPNDDYRREAFKKSNKGFTEKWQNAISLKEYVEDKSKSALEDLLSNGSRYLNSELNKTPSDEEGVG